MWSISIIFKYYKIPFIVIPHGSLTPNTLNKDQVYLKKIYIKLFELPLYKRAKFIIALSDIEKKNLLRVGVPTNIRTVTVNQGFSANDIPQKLRKTFFDKFNINGNIIKISYLGRIDYYQKGLDVLLNSIEILVKQYNISNIKVFLAGSDYENSLAILKQKIKSKKLDDYFQFIGSLHGTIKYDFLYSSDLFVLLSRWEGLPLAALEAIYCGLPIVVSPYTGLENFINKNKCGIVCNLDEKQIANNLFNLLQNNDINKFKKDINIIRKHLLLTYNWEKMALKINEFYNEI
jgi:glycosyltransferase involved in cell wall biosynthesis